MKLKIRAIGLYVTVLVSLFACKENKNKEFIYVEGNKLMLKKEPFFPLMLNYMSILREEKGELYLGPAVDYKVGRYDKTFSKDRMQQVLENHFKVIKMMGFNSIRLVGINKVETFTDNPNKIFLRYTKGETIEHIAINDSNCTRIVSALKEVSVLANKYDLRIMILLPKPKKNLIYTKGVRSMIATILKELNDIPEIFSYDFFNEPIYFDNSEYHDYKLVHRDKHDVYNLVSSWRKLKDKLAPNQLMTISLAEPIEVFEWDPNILPVDFISMHTYHPLRVPNEIYWYSNYISKPWIISETSLPSENDSIPYSEQAIFMREALQRTINCGGTGFGWWQFRDVDWGPFEHNYTALINNIGFTTLDNGDSIIGTIKPAGNVLPQSELVKDGPCDCMPNYYNMLGYSNRIVEGRILDFDTEKPIEGAVIRGWSEYWNIGMNTFTDEKGNFLLYSNIENVHFEISAPGYQTAKFDRQLEYQKLEESVSDKSVNLNKEYHNTHYQPFVKKESRGRSVFDFDTKYFGDYQYIGQMGEIRLKEVRFSY